MDETKTTFSITSYSNSDIINIGTPLNVAYLIDENYTIDNTNGIIYPNSAVVHKNVYDTVSKINYLLLNTEEQPSYTEFNMNNWYGSDSLVYTYNEDTTYYKFYKAIKMTNPLVPLTNTSYWNTYDSPLWSINDGDETYLKGTIVHTEESGGVYTFYESLELVPINIELTNTIY
jgi:hypothetical protein